MVYIKNKIYIYITYRDDGVVAETENGQVLPLVRHGASWSGGQGDLTCLRVSQCLRMFKCLRLSESALVSEIV